MICRFILLLIVTFMFGNKVLCNGEVDKETIYTPHSLGFFSMKDIKEKFTAALKNFHKILQEKIGIAMVELKKFKTKITDIIKSASQKVDDLIKKASDKIKKKFSKLQEKPKTVSNCFKEKGAQIVELSLSSVKQAKNCLTNQINETNEILEAVILKINSSYIEIDELKLEMDNCGSNFVCVLKISKKVAFVAGSVPVGIAKQVTEMREYVTNFSKNMISCGYSIVKEIGAKGGKLLVDAAKCVAA